MRTNARWIEKEDSMTTKHGGVKFQISVTLSYSYCHTVRTLV